MSIHTSMEHGKRPSPEIMADAERWYARLKAPDCSASERREFERWKAGPENAAAYERIELLWHALGKLAGRPDFESLSQHILADTALRSHGIVQRRSSVPASVAVATLIALVGGGVFVISQYREARAVVYATKPGERSIVKLADGSQLVLNYATELDVRLDKEVRRVTLHKGEALFAVAHDATRPFRVDAGDGEVTALGTRFEVRHDAQHVAVTLLEGSVAVDRRKEMEHVQLEPGDQVRFTEATPKMSRRTVDSEVVASWSTGRLRFRVTPLGDALEEVNRYSIVQIRIVDPTLSDIPISGTFELGDTASVVSALEALLPIQAAEAGGEVLLRRRK